MRCLAHDPTPAVTVHRRSSSSGKHLRTVHAPGAGRPPVSDRFTHAYRSRCHTGAAYLGGSRHELSVHTRLRCPHSALSLGGITPVNRHTQYLFPLSDWSFFSPPIFVPARLFALSVCRQPLLHHLPTYPISPYSRPFASSVPLGTEPAPHLPPYLSRQTRQLRPPHPGWSFPVGFPVALASFFRPLPPGGFRILSATSGSGVFRLAAGTASHHPPLTLLLRRAVWPSSTGFVRTAPAQALSLT